MGVCQFSNFRLASAAFFALHSLNSGTDILAIFIHSGASPFSSNRLLLGRYGFCAGFGADCDVVYGAGFSAFHCSTSVNFDFT